MFVIQSLGVLVAFNERLTVKFRILSAIFGVFIAGSAAAAPLNLVCDLRVMGTRGSGAFLSSPVVFLIKDSQKTADVLNGLILSVNKKAVQGRVRKSSKGLRVSWRVNNIPVRGGGLIGISYSATVDRKTNRFKVTGRISNAVNDIRGVGTCRELTQSEIKQGNFSKR